VDTDIFSEPLILILGGARSGKSAYAEKLAAQYGPDILYLATAEAGDDEMAARIKAHRASRPDTWHTLEAPRHVAHALSVYAAAHPAPAAILLDCLTLLTSNILLATEKETPPTIEVALIAELDALLSVWRTFNPIPALIIVSNEVGMGVVPPYKLGRLYQDLLGRANQWLARKATRVIFMLAGLPMEMKRAGESQIDD